MRDVQVRQDANLAGFDHVLAEACKIAGTRAACINRGGDAGGTTELLGVDAERFAQIAAVAFTPRPVPTVATGHLHELRVSVPEQAKRLLAILEARGSGQWASFSELVADCQAPIEVVGRFLALLELYRSRAVAFEQSEPLGVLQVSWTGERPPSEALGEVRDQ